MAAHSFIASYLRIDLHRSAYDPKAYLASLAGKGALPSAFGHGMTQSQAPPNVTLFSPSSAHKFLQNYSSSLSAGGVADFETFHAWPPVPNVTLSPYRCLGERDMTFADHYQAARSPSSYASSSNLMPYNDSSRTHLLQEHQALYNTMASSHANAAIAAQSSTMASDALSSSAAAAAAYSGMQYDVGGSAYYSHATRFTPFS